MRIIIIVLLALISENIFSQQNISQETKTYLDTTRGRILVTEIWYPKVANSQKSPLVIFSHGTGGNRLACQWFCEGLAAKGFIVAAVDHYGNTFTNPIPKEFVAIWERPQDISFVLTKLLNDNEVADKINQQKIYAAGFSIGGYTSLALAGAKLNWDNIIKFIHTPQGLREVNIPEMPGMIKMFEQDSITNSFKKCPPLIDKRIKAVFAMAPAAGQGFSSKRQFKDIAVPVFIVGVAADSIAPIKTNASHYKKLLPKAEWYLVEGKAGHYVFLNEGTAEMKNAAPVFFQDAEGVNRNEIHSKMISMAEIFFAKQK